MTTLKIDQSYQRILSYSGGIILVVANGGSNKGQLKQTEATRLDQTLKLEIKSERKMVCALFHRNACYLASMDMLLIGFAPTE